MEKCEPTREELSAQIRTLEERLWEAEQTIAAIQSGEVDALVIHKPEGEQLYTLTGADHGYRVLVESVSEGALILSSDDSIYYCNRTLGEILQLPLQKIISRKVDSYVAAEARPQLMELIKESRSLGAAKGEFLMKRNDGTLLPVNVSLNRLSMEGFEGVCAVITDLTEQKRAEEELRRHRTELESLVKERTAELQREIIERKRAEEEVRGQREWLRVTLTSIGDAVIATDEAARITFINPVAAELTGWREEEVRGKLVQEVFTVINEKTREPAEDVIRHVLRDGRVALLANHSALVTRDGREIPIEDSAAPIRDSAGNVIGVVLVFHDVTARRRAQETLKQSEERLQALMKALPVGVSFSHDANCRFVTGNPAVLAQFEVAPEDNLSASAADLNTPGRQLRFFREGREISDTELPLQRAIAEDQEIPTMEFEVLLASGRRWFSEASGAPLRNSEGKVVGGVAVTVDITERKLAEEKIRYQRAILEAINHIFHQTLTCETEEQLGTTCLKAAVELTQSKYGFIGEFDQNGSLYDTSLSDPGWAACALSDQSGHGRPKIDFKIHGLYGRVLLDGKSLLTNDPTSHPDSIGTPPGHPPLTAFLGVPLIHGRKIQGILGLANREGGYTPEHQQAIEAIAPAIVEAFYRKRAEQELRENRSQLDLALRSAQMGVWQLDLIENKRLFDYQVCHLLGIDSTQFSGTAEEFYQTVHPEDREMLKAALARTIEKNVPYETEYRTVWPDGSVHDITSRAKLFHDDTSRPVRINGLIWDISERKKAEHALRESEARFKLLSETAGCLLAAEDPQVIVNELCRQVMELLDCHTFFNFLVDEQAGKLHLNAWGGIPEEEARKIEWLDYGVAVCGCAARDRLRIVAVDIFNTPDVRTDLIKSYGIQAYACHPLMVEDRLIGTLSFGTRTRTRFSPKELEVMKTVADQVAVAMERIRLIRELQRSKDELEIRVQERTRELVMTEDAVQRANRALRTINACNETLIRDSEEQDLLNHVCEIIVQAGGYRMAWVGFAEPDEIGKVRPLAYAGYDEGYLETADISWADTDRGRGPTGLAIREGKIHNGKNIQTQPNLDPWRAEALRRGYASSIALPLMVNARTYGALTIYASEPDAFSEEETKLLASLADNLSYGIASIQAQTERKRAEEEIIRAKTMLQKVFDGISDPLLLVGNDFVVKVLNEAACTYFQVHDTEEAIGKICYELARGKCTTCNACAIHAAILKGERVTFERMGLFEPGHVEQVTVYPTEDADGSPGAIIRISDITEIRNLEKHMLHVDRLSSLGQLSGGIAHEIRNPLAGINLFVDVLSDEDKFARTSQELNILEEIKSNIKKIDGIIRRVLDFSRQSKTNARSKLEISSLIEDTLKLWRPRIGREGIELRLFVEEDLPAIFGDSIEIQQVLNNLVDNAIDVMSGGGLLSIAARRCTFSAAEKRPAVSITVQDSGSGIPLEAQDNIFNPFFTTKATGTGLGLAISHRIISRHGGIIFFETAANVGTTFHIEFPVASGG